MSFKKKKINIEKKWFFSGVIGGILLANLINPKLALAASLPWEGPLETIYNSLTGKVARYVTGIVIVGTGIMIGSSEGGGAARKGLQLVFGLALALGAIQFIELFGS